MKRSLSIAQAIVVGQKEDYFEDLIAVSVQVLFDAQVSFLTNAGKSTTRS